MTVKKENYNVNTSEIQELIVSNETSEITLKVLPAKATDGKVDFTLTGLPAGATFASSDGVTSEAVTGESTSLKVNVPSTPDDYTFTITNNGKTKTVTVHVINATMGGIYTLERIYNTSGISSEINSDVATALAEEEVAFTEPANDTVSGSSQQVEYKMNINKLDETTIEGESARHFVVKVKLSNAYTFYEGDELVAVNAQTGTKYVMVHSSTETNSYYVYLNAEEKAVDLVIANKNSTEAQISSETNKVTIKVVSTSVLGLDAHSQEPKITSVTSNLPEQSSVTGKMLAKVEKDTTEYNTLNVYTKTDLINEYSSEFTLNGKTYPKAKWIGITVPVLHTGLDNDGITSSVSEEDKVIVTTQFNTGEGDDDSGLSNIQDKDWTAAVVIWLQIPDYEKEGSFEHTYTVHLKYTNGPTEEECDLKINMINAAHVYVKSIEPAEDDAITKGVVTSSYTFNTNNLTSASGQVTKQVASISLNRNAIPERKINDGNPGSTEQDGRWIKLKITYNVPMDVIVTANYSQSADALDTGNVGMLNTNGLLNNADEYSEYVWFNVDDNSFSSGFDKTVANGYGLRNSKAEVGDTNFGGIDGEKDGLTKINLKLEDTSSLQVPGSLNGWREQRFVPKYEDFKNLEAAGNMPLSVELKDAMKTYKTKEGDELVLLAKSYGDMKIDGKAGKWVLTYLDVKEEAKVTVLENTDAFVVDYENAEAAFGQTRVSIDQKSYDRIAVWINLDKLVQNKTADEIEGQSAQSFTLKLGLSHEAEGLLDETVTLNCKLKFDLHDTSIPWDI